MIKLRPGVHYAPVAGGVYIDTPRGHFVLRGPAALYQVLDELIPLLEDGTTQVGAVAALEGTGSPRMVTQVLSALRAKGLFLDIDGFSAPLPDPGTRKRYAGALTDLETDSDDPYAAFARVRAARVLVAGPATAVLPAARGLLRAGVGNLVLAVPEPEQVRALADRNPEMSTAELRDGKIASGAGEVSAAVYASDDVALLDVQRAELPDGCPVVPVLAGGEIAITGPAVRGPDGAEAWRVLCGRAQWWRDALALAPVALPTGAALAGALAGRAVFRALSGTGRDGEAHVIYGDTLTADVVRITGPESASGGGTVTADTAAPDVAPAAGAALAAVHEASRRWTGSFAVITPETLPQMPVSLVTARHRAAAGTDLLAWGANQEYATISVALSCLRGQAAAQAGSTGAAGTTQARWLLDGALRLLAGQAVHEAGHGFANLTTLTERRLWRAIEDYELVPITARTSGLAGISWKTAAVYRTDTGRLLATAWGPGATAALTAALAAATARLQSARTAGPACAQDNIDTTELISAPSAAVTRLLEQVRAYGGQRGRTLTGTRAEPDALGGTSGLWHGRVRLSGEDGQHADGNR
jgi:hypothetical protein